MICESSHLRLGDNLNDALVRAAAPKLSPALARSCMLDNNALGVECNARNTNIHASAPVDLAMDKELANVRLAGRAGLDHLAHAHRAPRAGRPRYARVVHVAEALPHSSQGFDAVTNARGADCPETL